MSAVVGALRAVLSLETAAFEKGAARARSSLAGIQRGLDNFSRSATRMGKSMSLVSGTMAAVGVAAAGVVTSTANAGAEIANQARVANSSVSEFQRMAAAASSVGISNEKMADILKDTGDKVGDFLTTGGGPLADFFENIAPKVGVTAEQFKNLSGPQALQLYASSLEKANLSQAEMTFYMEALASDSTALLPLLADNGAEMNRLADAAANAGGIMSDKAVAASVEFKEKLRLLGDGMSGLRNTIGESLLPVFNKLLDMVNAKIVPALHTVVESVGGVVQWFTDLPAPVQEAAAVIAAALGIGGPVLLAIGAVSAALSLLVGAAGPIGLFITAATLATAAWVKWGDDIKAAIRAAIDWITTRFDEFISFVQGLPAKLAEVGRNMIQGLIDGITEKWEALKAKVYELAEMLPDWMKDVLEIRSPSRVFREIGQWITEGLSLGITDNIGMAQGAIQTVGAAISGSSGSLTSGISGFGDMAVKVFEAVAIRGAKLSDTLKSMFSSWATSTASKLFTSGLKGLFGFADGGAFSSGRVMAFANGGVVSGPMTFPMQNGTGLMGEAGPEAIMPLTRIGGKLGVRADGGGIDLRITMDESTGALGGIARNEAGRVIAQEQPRMVAKSLAAARADMRRSKAGWGL